MSESFFGAYMVMLGEFGVYDEQFETVLPRLFLVTFLLMALVVSAGSSIVIIVSNFTWLVLMSQCV
jgi:hypothetical protein